MQLQHNLICTWFLSLLVLSVPASATEKEPGGFVDIVTREYTIEGPKSLGLGWHNFRFRNQGGQAHFVSIYKMSEGKDLEDQLAEVAPVFDPLMNGLRSGELTKADIGPFLQEHLPPWGLQMGHVGGPGLMAPGKTSHTAIRFDEPGIYLMECYVKGPDGNWHTMMGMLKQLEITGNRSGGIEPQATSKVAVSNSGIEAPGTLTAGKQTFRIDFLEAPPGPFPFDVHIARLEEDTDMDRVVHWMDWTNVGGLRAPAPVEFLGGMEHMQAGRHGYVAVDLDPGQYLWISRTNAARMQARFTVK